MTQPDPDWDVCPHCGKSLGQSEEARFDEDGDPVTGRTYHPECSAAAYAAYLQRGEPGAVVYMYKRGETGPLSG